MGPFAYNEDAIRRAGESSSKATFPYLPPAKDKKPKRRSKKKLRYTPKKKLKISKEEQNEEEHAVLIVGIDTDMDDPKKRYLLVKNTAGRKWGIDGCSQLSIEAFNYIVVPSYTAKNLTYKDSKSLEKLEDEEILNKCILVEGVGIYNTDEEIEHEFGKFGDVEQFQFLVRDDRTHTRACIVKFKDQGSVDEVLAETDTSNIIQREDVTVSRFDGMPFHQHVYDKGSYKMIIKGYKKMDETKDTYELLDIIFQESNFTSIELLKENYILTGEAKIRFRTAEALEKAKKRAVEENIAFRIPS